jgi:hypothetical protein
MTDTEANWHAVIIVIVIDYRFLKKCFNEIDIYSLWGSKYTATTKIK